MAVWLRMLAVGALLLGGGAAAAQERVEFPSLDAAATPLVGHLLRPAGPGPHPAVVFLHGCGGLYRRNGGIVERETDWAARLVGRGYAVLMVDSFTPRGHQRMCAPDAFAIDTYLARPKDAYGALRWLQAQPFVRPDRVGVVGWSQGGGTVLFSVREASLGRPADLPDGDFRAAVAFYPASCADRFHKLPWTSRIPLLVLAGDKDVWTPAAPCLAFVAGAAARGAPVWMKVYDGAVHDFDWPGMAVQELPAFRTAAGVVPLVGMEPAARADALERLPAFLDRYLKP